ncbi:MAG: MarR family transcriptional regulator [Bryobacteraceae bacterium]|jgi:DNA-binding MarR family transcriptional regulator
MPYRSPAYALHKFVFDLDRAADGLLRKRLNISYKRALFLLVLKHHGTVTQHELATALGYSDPAVSTMLAELEKCGYLTAAPSPEHGRKRLVTITRAGSALVKAGTRMLDSRFAELMASAGVDAEQYQQMTEQLQQALSTGMKEEKS